MCGRYQRKADKQAIAEYFHLRESGEDLSVEAAPSYNIAPTSMQPVIVRSPDTGERELRIMRWGLIPAWCKDIKKLGTSTINAMAESVADKPIWRGPFKKRRCLVPANGFYEWKKLDVKNKQPFVFELKSQEPLAFAGLWEHWRAPDSALEFDTFSIITTEANELAAGVHTRMPVILNPSDYDRWLATDNPDQPPTDLLRPFDAAKMTAHPVDPRVGNVRNNDAALCDNWSSP
jgi:putative SOS response-associated peptidase YedK